jgi:uncharacterized protein YqeY
MDLQTRLTEEMKTAMRSGDKDRLAVIRMLLNDVKNVDLAAKPTTPEQAVEAYGKKLRKSIEEYQKLSKPAEARKLEDELKVVNEFLPQKASAGETEKMLDEFLDRNKFTEKEFGRAMGAFIKEHGSKVDPGVVSAELKKKLAGR